MASNHRADSGSSEGLANFFFGTFFFLAKKKVVRSPLAKENLSQKALSANKKQSSFSNEFIEYEKSYLFHIQSSKKINGNKKVNAVAMFFQ